MIVILLCVVCFLGGGYLGYRFARLNPTLPKV